MRILPIARVRRWTRLWFVAAAALIGVAAPAAAQPVPVVTEYYHLDALGSTRVVTSQAGTVLRHYDYAPFGEQDSPCAQSPDKRLFTGQVRDRETCLDYYGARHMRSTFGRFLTIDPVLNTDAALIDPQQWNRYAYARNNPLKFVDPDGRNPVVVGAAIGAAVYGGWQVYQNWSQGRPWYENLGVEASTGLIVGATLGVAAPVVAAPPAAEIGVLTAAGTGAAANALGVAREVRVAQLVGGRVAGDVKVTLHGVGTTAIDVYGKAGEFIGVGGPAKGVNLSDFGTRLKVLASAAEQAGVKAQYYFARGTSLEAVRLAEKWLGKGNVHWFE